MKLLRFDSTQGRLRVVVSDGGVETEVSGLAGSMGSNIFLGRVAGIDLMKHVCTVDCGSTQPGILPFDQIADRYRGKDTPVGGAPLSVGQALLVQTCETDSDEVLLTSFISLHGQYLTAMPCGAPLSSGIHETALSGPQLGWAASRLKANPDLLLLPASGLEADSEVLNWDLSYLMQLWSAIEGAAKSAPPPFLIYQDDSPVIRAVRDHCRPDIEEILVDSAELHEQVSQYLSHVMPQMAHRVMWVPGAEPQKSAPDTLLARLGNWIFRQN